MFLVAEYNPITGGIQNETRLTIGGICIALWFFLFPALGRDKKDKITFLMAINLICTVFALVISSLLITYFMNYKGSLGGDILACIGGVILFTYVIFIAWTFVDGADTGSGLTSVQKKRSL